MRNCPINLDILSSLQNAFRKVLVLFAYKWNPHSAIRVEGVYDRCRRTRATPCTARISRYCSRSARRWRFVLKHTRTRSFDGDCGFPFRMLPTIGFPQLFSILSLHRYRWAASCPRKSAARATTTARSGIRFVPCAMRTTSICF